MGLVWKQDFFVWLMIKCLLGEANYTILLRAESKDLIKSFSLARRIQGSVLLIFSIGTISKSCRLCPWALKWLPTVVDPVLIVWLCSLKRLEIILLVWPTYWGLLTAQDPLFFLQVIRYITFLLVQSRVLKIGKISLVLVFITLLQNRGELWSLNCAYICCKIA